jgi:hypothetical protein
MWCLPPVAPWHHFGVQFRRVAGHCAASPATSSVNRTAVNSVWLLVGFAVGAERAPQAALSERVEEFAAGGFVEQLECGDAGVGGVADEGCEPGRALLVGEVERDRVRAEAGKRDAALVDVASCLRPQLAVDNDPCPPDSSEWVGARSSHRFNVCPFSRKRLRGTASVSDVQRCTVRRSVLVAQAAVA